MTSTDISLTMLTLWGALLAAGCSSSQGSATPPLTFAPREIIDLGAVVTEDLPERFWGRAMLKLFGFERPNSFEVKPWSFKAPTGELKGSDSYYTLFNHGGPHVDAPNHMSAGGGIDSYRIDSYAGPARVFDARRWPPGRSIPVDLFRDSVKAGEIVLVYTNYRVDHVDSIPKVVTLTQEAADYLAALPVRAFGTDGLGVESPQESAMGRGDTPGAQVAPVHYAFLSRGIPVYEELVNLGQLLGKARLYFVGAPLNIKNGDGMLVRPVVFVY